MGDDLTPRQPYRPLRWPGVVYELCVWLAERSEPVYVVGGAVRDALLHRPLHDLDLVVPRGGMVLARRIADRLGGAYFPLDAERDVGRAILNIADGERFTVDVARLRGPDLRADLADRDFTVNALAVDLLADPHLLIDPLGGEVDAREKVIRRCGPQSLASDPVRCLRAVRLSAQLNMRIERETVNDIRRWSFRLADVSPERVRDELFRLLALPKAGAALRAAAALGLTAPIIPEVDPASISWQRALATVDYLAAIVAATSPVRSDNLTASFGMGMLIMQLDRFRERLQEHLATSWPNERSHRALLALAALFSATGTAALDNERAAQLRLSVREGERLAQVVCGFSRLFTLDVNNRRVLHRFWREAKEAGVDMCLLAAADYLAAAGSALDQDAWLAVIDKLCTLLNVFFNRYHEIVAPPPVVDGRTLMQALGLASGPEVGALLTEIREAQAAGEVQTQEDALQLARARLNRF